MENSAISLLIDKGDQKGEIHVSMPGKVIRIGRVVKGNTLFIRDPGISQKHLTVYFRLEITRWVVTDLGSSNGTYINGSLISPKEPYSLSDGDIIKIGEMTSISVKILDPVAKPLVLPIPKRHGKPPKAVTFEDEWQDNLDEPGGKRLRGRTIGRKGRNSTRVLKKGDEIDTVGVNMSKEEEEDVVILSNLDFENVSGKEKQLKENNIGAEEEVATGVGENNSKAEEMEVDINNMTLGEWFDRMEEYLPHAISKAAEETIAKMREKARLCEEYIAQTSDVQR